MKKINIIAACMLGVASLGLTSCGDVADEITSIVYDRYFSPTDLTAKVRNRTNIEVSWKAVNGASQYVVEVYSGSDESGTKVGEQTTTETTVLVTGLEGETTYYVRVKATGESNNESKWNGATATTDAEQIFKTVDESDLTSHSVTLRWTAGQTATSIVLTDADGKETTHTVTADEITAGEATISDLASEVTYTAKLLNGTKVRGTVSFTTLVDVGNSTTVSPGDDFVSILENAKDGDSFAFYPGTYIAPSDGEATAGEITIKANIEIKAVRPSDRPVLNGAIKLTSGASLGMKQVVLDGTGTAGSNAIDFKDVTTYGALTIEDCEIKNFDKSLFNISAGAITVNEITINNSLIHDIKCSGGDMLDCRTGYIKVLTLSNSTVWNSCDSRDFVRMDNASASFPGASPIITIDHCTLDGISNDSARRILYVRFKGNSITFTNNIVSNLPECGRGFSDSGDTATPTFSNNNYFNTTNLVSAAEGGKGKFFDSKGTTLDPQYKDASAGDFTIGNQSVADMQAGDPRWY